MRTTPTRTNRLVAVTAAFLSAAILTIAAPTPANADEPVRAVFTNADGEPLSGDDLAADSARGDIQLHWALDPPDADASPMFRLVGRLDGELVDDRIVYYEGPQRRSFISGLEDGTHEFVVMARLADTDPWGPESEAIVFTVEHHSLRQTFILLGIGAFLFIAIVFVVVREAIFAENPFADEDDAADPAPTDRAAGKGDGA
ncbi:MAG: hypothetical protein EA423_12945 [Phycisphaerales bacterium]|nr:MAG: hypothetical protein EA423_12945 [Phycisphaerales bacterium]